MKNYFHKDLPDTLYRHPQYPVKSLIKIIYEVDLQMCYSIKVSLNSQFQKVINI